MTTFLSVVWDVNPEIFSLGFISIRYYGLMFVIAFALGLYIYAKMLKRENMPENLADDIFYIVGLATLIGARLGHCLFYEPDYYLAHPIDIISPFRNGHFVGYAGLASHGAAIGILIGLYIYSKRHKLAYLWTLDRIVITIALAGFFIRMGNLFNSEVYGNVTTLPWGFIFVHAGETLPKHPTQLYEGFSYLAIFFILYSIYLKTKPADKRNGFIFGLFLILLFSARFFIEFIKEPQVESEIGMVLNLGQKLSIPFVLAGVVILWNALRQAKTS